MLTSSNIQITNDVPDSAPPIPPDFYNGVASLATAADSLSKAAEAMAAAARAMSEVSRVFGALNILPPDAAAEKEEAGGEDNEPVGPHEHEVNCVAEPGSDKCPSEAPSGEIIVYDDDGPDYKNPKPASSDNSNAAHRPIGTKPLSNGFTDNAQTWLRYYSPPQPQAAFGASLSFPNTPNQSSSAEGGHATRDPAEPEPKTRSSDEVKATTGLVPDILDAQQPKNGASGPNPTPSEKIIGTATSGLNMPTSTNRPTTKQLGLRESVSSYPKLPSGRNYIHLEENFDALPIISYMALASRKTICLVPSSGSLSSYKTILNAVTGLEIFEQVLDQFIGATGGAVLLLPFTAIPAIFRHAGRVDCVVHWGWPCSPQHWSALATSVTPRTRLCLLIPSGQHLKPEIDSAASDYGVKRYPATDLKSFLGPESPIHEIRKDTIQVLTKINPETPKMLYHSWLSYYGAGPNRRTDWALTDLIDYGWEYAATTLLQGWPSDGSKVYPPIATRRLPLPDWIIERAATSVPRVSAGSEPNPTPAKASASSPHPQRSFPHPSPNPTVPPSRQPGPSSSPMPLSSQIPGNLGADLSHPGRYFVVLEEEFDAIPLISYLATKNKKTVCYVSSPESPKHYKTIFEATANLAVTFPTAIKYAQKMQAQLASVSKPTMLVQFYWALHSAGLLKSAANAVICLGAPTDVESYVNGGAKNVAHSYLILNANEYNNPKVQAALLRHGITAHPASTSINDHSASGPLAQMRQKTIAFFEMPGFSVIAKSLYYFFISYHCTGQGRPGWTPETIARAANTYAAKLLLQGRREDGSDRYPPLAGRPCISSGAIKAFKLKKAMSMGLVDSE